MKFKAGAAVVLTLTAFVAFAQQDFRSRRGMYSATADIEIIKRNVPPAGPNQGDRNSDNRDRGNRPPGRDTNSLDVEMEEILSRPVLEEVARKLNLDEIWRTANGFRLSRDRIYTRLRTCLSVRQARNYPLLYITATGDDPIETELIANTTAEVFAKRIKDQNNKEKKAKLRIANQEVDLQRKVIQQLERNVKTRRKAEGFREHLSTDEEDAADEKRDIRKQIKQTQYNCTPIANKLNKLENQLKRLTALTDRPKELASKLSPKNQALESLNKEIGNREKQLEKKKKSLGEDHPDVLADQAALDELKANQNAAIEEALKDAQAQCLAQQELLDELDEKIADLTLMLSAPPRAKSPELKAARAEYETQTVVFNDLKKEVSRIKNTPPTRSADVVRLAVAELQGNARPGFGAGGGIPYNEPDYVVEHVLATSRISVMKRERLSGYESGFGPSGVTLALEIATITSRPVLIRVARRLNRTGGWARSGMPPSSDEAWQLLQSSLTVQQIGDTPMIEITAESPDAGEAVAMANETARAYQQYVDEQVQLEEQREMVSLQNGLSIQEGNVRQAELEHRRCRMVQGLSNDPFITYSRQLWLENAATRAARNELEFQKAILIVLQRRLAEMSARLDEPPRCSVEIVSIAVDASAEAFFPRN